MKAYIDIALNNISLGEDWQGMRENLELLRNFAISAVTHDAKIFKEFIENTWHQWRQKDCLMILMRFVGYCILLEQINLIFCQLLIMKILKK